VPQSPAPIVSLAQDGSAIVIQRNLPEPVAYRGKGFIALSFLEEGVDPRTFFNDAAFEVPPERGGRPFADLAVEEVRTAVNVAMRAGFSDRRIFPNAQPTTTLRLAEGAQPTLESTAPIGPELRTLSPDIVSTALKSGRRLHVYRNLVGVATYRLIDEPQTPEPELYLVEQYQLSTHLGRYGAGRVVNTFSLLPGERTKISVRSFLKTETERKEASSILDSVTHESAQDFQAALETEQSDKRGYEKTFEFQSQVEASVSWGFGSAKASAGVRRSTNAAREELSKSVTKAVEQHSATSSAKRDVEVNTSFEVKHTVEDETSIEREIENINVSRTLNFTFRQMNQEFFSVLHLIDVRVAFFNGFAESRREVALYDLDSLLHEVVKPEHHAAVRDGVSAALGTIVDYRGDLHDNFIVERTIGGESYPRVNRELVSEYADPVTGSKVTVPGIITAVTTNVMRTEGVIVEAVLGEVGALDTYAARLQEIEVARRDAERRHVEADARRAELLNTIIEERDPARARLYERLVCPCGGPGEASGPVEAENVEP
jgi:hypothetical protein